MTTMKQSSITAKGQTTIPREVREALGLSAGDKVRYIVEGKEVRMRKVGSLKDLVGMLHRPGQRTISIEEMEEGIAAGATDEE